MITNQWYAILPSRKVKIGQIVAVKRLNLELALFRNSKGELSCVVDQCSHRGAALSLGKVKNDCIQCPFHGMEFDKDGKCTFIPANGTASTEDLSQFNVKHYTVRERNGIVYLWYGDEDKITEELPFFYDQLDSFYACSEIEDHWNTNYSRCIESQLDVMHLPFVHQSTIGKGNKTLVNGPKVVWQNGILKTSSNNEPDYGQKPRTPDECVIKETHLRFLFPNLWMGYISEKLKVIIYFAPVDDENTILYIRLCNKLTRFKNLNSFIAYIGKFINRRIASQIRRVVSTQKPVATELNTSENLIQGDAPIIMYRKIREDLKA
ncbi:MAG: Rieske 2Fe-2S domain-containing protein [Acetivibrionales bacterium]|mgnify:CR=1 FL=1|jgi:phenylpropionate dioxygenase-like ring-hydroxylating dioxygenase large terminal subunit